MYLTDLYHNNELHKHATFCFPCISISIVKHVLRKYKPSMNEDTQKRNHRLTAVIREGNQRERQTKET